MSGEVNHLVQEGLVIHSSHDHVKISLTGAGCTACHNSLCMLGESKAKEIEVLLNGKTYTTGDQVLVKINPASGYKALALLYLIPFCLMMIVLVSVTQSGYTEEVAGVASLLILFPYFGMLFLLRKQIDDSCKFEIEKK